MTGTPKGMVVRKALEETVASEENQKSFTVAAGSLVGSLRGPRDLSTILAHLDGYGRSRGDVTER